MNFLEMMNHFLQKMSTNKTTTLPQRFLRCIFAFALLAVLAKAESASYAPQAFCYYSSPDAIALVLPVDVDLSSELETPQTPASLSGKAAFPQIGQAENFTLSLLEYDHFVRRQLQHRRPAFSPSHRTISTLQKMNIWHHSAGEEPPLHG